MNFFFQISHIPRVSRNSISMNLTQVQSTKTKQLTQTANKIREYLVKYTNKQLNNSNMCIPLCALTGCQFVSGKKIISFF